MKIRSGFVSNSSSASFIIKWKIDTDRCEGNSKEERVQRAIIAIMDATWLDIKQVMDKEANDGDSYSAIIRDMIEHTDEIDEETGKYVTSFWTIMYNCASDWGRTPGDMLMALETDYYAHLLETKVINDH